MGKAGCHSEEQIVHLMRLFVCVTTEEFRDVRQSVRKRDGQGEKKKYCKTHQILIPFFILSPVYFIKKQKKCYYRCGVAWLLCRVLRSNRGILTQLLALGQKKKSIFFRRWWTMETLFTSFYPFYPVNARGCFPGLFFLTHFFKHKRYYISSLVLPCYFGIRGRGICELDQKKSEGKNKTEKKRKGYRSVFCSTFP